MGYLVRALVLTLAFITLLGPGPAAAIELDAVSRAAAGYTVADPKLESMYRAALLNTNKQVTYASDGTAYVKTGDIPAEWLRDASVQVRPYLFFAKNDMQVDALLRGSIARMGKYLQVDPYANAFTLNYRVWEEKFELDSLAYPISLAWTYWKQTGDGSIFTGDLSLGFDKALDTMEREQDHPRNSQLPPQRTGAGRQGQPGRLHRHDLERLPALGRRLQVQLPHPLRDDGGGGAGPAAKRSSATSTTT